MENQMHLCNDCEYVFEESETNVDLVTELTCPECDSTNIEKLEKVWKCDECDEIYSYLPSYGMCLCESCRASYDYTEVWVDRNDKIWYEEF